MHTFYCTDKGKHSRRDIGTIQDGAAVNEAQKRSEQLFAEFGFPDQHFTRMPNRLVDLRGGKHYKFKTGKIIQKKYEALTSRQTKNGREWTFICPTCKRSPRVTDQQLKQLFDMAAEQPIIALDISNWAQ